MATEEADFQRAVSDRGISRSSRGTGDYRVRLDATRLANQARSWDDLASLIRRERASHAIDGPDDARQLIDIATSAFAARHGDPDSEMLYALSLRREVDDQAASARQRQIGARAQQLRDDPVLRARLEWQDRVRRLAGETGVDYQFAEEFVTEYERLSAPQFPGVIDPRGVPFIQVEVPLYASAYLIEQYILPFTEIGPLLGVYEAISGQDFLTGERVPAWARVLNVVGALLPFASGALGRGASALARGIRLAGQGLAEGARALAGLAVRIGKGTRAMLGFAGKLARLPAIKVQALLRRLTVAAKAAQGLRLAGEELRLAGQVDEAVKELSVVEAGARPRSMTASGVIEDGRALNRTQSGTLRARPAPALEAAAASAAGAARPLSRAAAALVGAGYRPEAIRALERLGVKVTAQAAKSLSALGATGRDFLNLFHRSKGFHRVVADLLKGGNKRAGAAFVMRFATQHPDILAKVRASPLNVAFEWGAGVTKTTRFGDVFAREVDIVVRGDAAIGEGDTIYNELKSWTEGSLKAAKGKRLPRQFVKDTALFNPHNIRWVFDSAKIGDKRKLIAAFADVIKDTPYLATIWGSDRAAIEAALDRVITVF